MALEKSGLYNYDPKSSMEFINTECVMYRQLCIDRISQP